MLKKIIVLILVVSMMITLGACSNEQTTGSAGTSETTSGNGKLDEIKKSGKLVLGTAAEYAPFDFHKIIDGEDQILGVDIEIGERIAEKIGVELEIVDMKFEGVLPALVMDDIDIIIAGMVATEERAEVVDFSIPYYNAENKMLIRKADKDKYKDFDDINIQGSKVGVQKSTTQETLANDICTEAEVVAITLLTDVILEVKGGKLDMALVDGPVAQIYEYQNDDLYMLEPTVGPKPGMNIAVNKGNQDLLNIVNSVIEEMVANCEVQQLVDKYTKMSQE